jgi:N-methylhydantoinase B
MRDLDPIRLEVFKHLFASIPEEMGVVLRKSAYSPNIKERRDFSCALFDAGGRMVAQAAHIPVHLGSMPLSVAQALHETTLEPGDVVILNDPFRGGTHLPDITLITPIFVGTDLFALAANRAHHADVGGMAPGSMPIAREIYQEGLIIPPVKLVRRGELDQAVWELILSNVRTPRERAGDLHAQLAANRRGVQRLGEMMEEYGRGLIADAMDQLLAYTERVTCQLLLALPDGTYSFTDVLDDNGVDERPVRISVRVTIDRDRAVVDFTGSDPQQSGSVNAVLAITLSAVYYVFRSLIGLDVPNNSGCLAPIRVVAPEGSVVNAIPPAPVAGGNVETSQRIVDVLLGALAQACPEGVPAASQGTMNNVTIGGWDPERNRPFAYYETVGGGMGARPGSNGPSAVHSHMTNTLNTPIEALEYGYPLRVAHYGIREGSGGAGLHRGGDGIRRDIELLCDAEVSLITERRRMAPYGLAGGKPGEKGRNVLIRGGKEQLLPGKGTVSLRTGDVLSIQTPGGGGYGAPEELGEPLQTPSVNQL